LQAAFAGRFAAGREDRIRPSLIQRVSHHRLQVRSEPLLRAIEGERKSIADERLPLGRDFLNDAVPQFPRLRQRGLIAHPVQQRLRPADPRVQRRQRLERMLDPPLQVLDQPPHALLQVPHLCAGARQRPRLSLRF
jgi:hypothetical protein